MNQPMYLYTVNIKIKRGLKLLACSSQLLAVNQSQAEASVLCEFHTHVQNFLETKIDYQQFCAGAVIETKQHTEPESIYFKWDIQ